DLLIWLFGSVVGTRVHLRERRRMAGFLELERARVRWFLSVDVRDLPERRASDTNTFRAIVVDGTEVEFSDGFSQLHTRVYEQTLAGNGFATAAAKPSFELAYEIRHAGLSPSTSDLHPALGVRRCRPTKPI